MKINLKTKLTRSTCLLTALVFVATLTLAALLPTVASAAQLTGRKLTLGGTGGSAPRSGAGDTTTSSHKFDFTTPSGASPSIGSMRFTYCTTASGSCTAPTNFDSSAATLTAQSGATGFTIYAPGTNANEVSITRTAAAIAASTPVSYSFTVKNPTTTNTSFYVRITDYSGTDATTGSTDTGVVAGSTATQITLTGTMDESLVFCVGITITGQNCGTIAGSSINFGTFSSTATRSATSVMAASTNATSGYAITTNGTTLTCASCSGSPTITALAAATASSIGSSQFGSNLVANATPSVGAAVSGSGTSTANTGYNTANSFKFATGDAVATSVNAPSNANTFTVSYIVNVPGTQQAGVYTSTLTYIATATY